MIVDMQQLTRDKNDARTRYLDAVMNRAANTTIRTRDTLGLL